MKICGLMPLKFDPEKSQLNGAIDDLHNTCDEIIVMHELGSNVGLARLVSEEIDITDQKDQTWNDWVNRVTLLVRAARLGCDYVMWLDDDERLGPSLHRDRVRGLCDVLERDDYTQIIVRVRHLWNETDWRCDGQFGQSFKTFLQPNPFVKNPGDIKFKWGPQDRLHHFPNALGASFEVQDYLIHHGHKTPSLREKSVQKYARHDPENKHSCVRYDWLLDETGIQLKPIHEPHI